MSSSIKESKSVESASPDPEKQAGGFESHDHVDDRIETLNVLNPDAHPSALDRTFFWGRSLALSAALERKVCAIPSLLFRQSILCVVFLFPLGLSSTNLVSTSRSGGDVFAHFD
ncbi:hypothetical protein B0H16DRAFT_1726845 [Mycena metata]|uniref:Uncharacterized protein n=1 Tax=Mycena metata TaxID=1033252 RepID=A0AAD7N4F4_9AGAR|nr:hypothetical protein B0H16DRAFT_1726845 [Mycena metata]